ncbi:hypothetical protein ACYVOT_003348 [Vibrio cholerae]
MLGNHDPMSVVCSPARQGMSISAAIVRHNELAAFDDSGDECRLSLAEPRRERFVPCPIIKAELDDYYASQKAALNQRFEIYHRASTVDSPSIEELAKDKTPRFTDRLVNGFKRFFGVSA